MKNRILLSTICFLSASLTHSQELIKDGNFDSTNQLKSYVDKGKPGELGVWTVYNAEAFGVAKFNLATDEKNTERGQGVELAVTPKLSTWYKAFVAQRVETVAEPGLYRLGFWAKSPDGGEVKAFIRLTGLNEKDLQKFFITTKNQPKKPTGKYYGSYVKVLPSVKWKYYTFDFDFAKTSDSFYLWELGTAKEANDVDLENFSVIFQNSGTTTNSVFIDGISLQKVTAEK